MIKNLKLKGFTLFQSASLDFARGLNVINTADEIGPISALDAEIDQSDRYLNPAE